MKKMAKPIEAGFVWNDPKRSQHVVACGDGTDLDFVKGLLERPPSLVLLDPPYNLSADAKHIKVDGRKDLYLDEKWDKVARYDFWAEVLKPMLDVAVEVAAPNGNVWCWCSDWWVSNIKGYLLRDKQLRVWPTYHWVKTNPPPSFRKSNPQSATEYLIMASHPGNYFDLAAMPNGQRNWYQSRNVTQKERLKRESGEDVNRTQKPIVLTEALVKAGSPQAELSTVLDFTGGTGTTLIAAERIGRWCVHVDKDAYQVRMALRRLKAERAK